ncbi:MAG TPA: SUF system Fe-S cluster assembly protein [Hyphomonadaceae bacterium]|nr:FeS assembly SUF system protein [Hyphomonadaceae bacterium UKL13-1]HCP64683.1 SUF system Fe-S cluster assembly protein [Hyphomonadaceae bacterium]
MSDETTATRDMLDVSSPPIVQPDREPSDLPPEEIARLTDDLIDAFKTVYDPEIPVDVYELGLIYKVDLKAGGHVDIDMTLTAPACPVAGELPIMVEDAAKTVNGINSAKAIVTFDPPWTQARMSDEARLALNML